MPSDFVQVHPNRYEFDFSQGNQVLAQSLVSETVALGRYFVVDLRIAITTRNPPAELPFPIWPKGEPRLIGAVGIVVVCTDEGRARR